MKLRSLFRLALLTALAGAIVWLALHREIIQTAGLERELARLTNTPEVLSEILIRISEAPLWIRPTDFLAARPV